MTEIVNQRIQLMRKKLQEKLNPTYLEIQDDSHLHIGHPGAQSGAGHFTVSISSPQFEGKNRVACHQLVYAALDNMIGPEIHALQIEIRE